MKVKAVLTRTVLALLLSQTLSCDPPHKPDYDIAIGTLIYKGICQNQRVYLVDLYNVHAHQSGYSYRDTLRVNGVIYSRVVRLDTTRASFLDQKVVGAKIAFDFLPTGKQSLPRCNDLGTGKLEYIQLLSNGDAQL